MTHTKDNKQTMTGSVAYLLSKEKNWQEWVDEDSLQLIMQLVTTISFGVLIGLVAYNEFGVRSITELILTPETAFLVSVVTVCVAVVFTRE